MIPMAGRPFVRWSLLMVAIVVGCNAPPRKAASPTSRLAANPAPWREYELTDEGLYARFPEEPVEGVFLPRQQGTASPRAEDSLGVGMHYLRASGKGPTFACARIRPLEVGPGPSPSQRTTLAQSMAPGFFRGSALHSAAQRLGDFNGETLVGEDHDGNAQIVVSYRLGGGLLLAWVTGHGKDLDRKLASSFFASLRLSAPWQVRALPDLGLTIAIPKFATEVPKPGEVDFVLGGVDDLDYSVTVRQTASDASAVAALHSAETLVVEKVVSSKATEHDGAPGRDFVVTHGNRYGRLQFFAVNKRLYRIAVASTSLGKLDDGDAKRFFESLRIFE